MAKILVVEDRPELREGILELLETENLEAIGAATGEEAIQLASSDQFDLILCDIIMPGLDGYHVLNQLRQSPKNRDIPFIFLSAKSERDQIRLGMNLGADDYLTKPCTNREILEAMNESDFPYPLIQFLQTLRLDPRYIEVEIPATAIAKIHNIKTMANKLLALKSSGISTTLAQLGINQMNLCLQDLAFDAIKLDSRFMSSGIQNNWLLKALIKKGHNLKLKVIADGVKSENQMQFLRQERCDEAQRKVVLTKLEIKQFL